MKEFEMGKLLKVKDFSFEKFRDGGDSGHMYLATRKKDGKKYVVKHWYSDCACNEFVYFSVAKALGLRTLDFYLFENDVTKKTFFSGYAIAIEYIDADDLAGFSKQKDRIRNWQDFFSHKALFAAFSEEDSFEFLLNCEDLLYRIDTSASFSIDYVTIASLGFTEFREKAFSNTLNCTDEIVENLKKELK